MAAEPNFQYRPEFWVYAALLIAALVLFFIGGQRAITAYQASTGIILNSDDVASVQGTKPADLNNGQVAVHITLTASGADKFAAAKPDVPVYFKGHEIGTAGTVNGNTVTLQVALLDAAKTKLELKWKDNQ